LERADNNVFRKPFAFDGRYASRNNYFSLSGFASIAYTSNKKRDTLLISGVEIKLQPKIHQGNLRAEGFRFAIVASRWNDFLTARLTEGAIDSLERLGADEDSVEVFKVPGSFEIPVLARKLAEGGRFDAVICVGTILRGQTPHFDFVAGAATKGIAQAAMDTGIPVVYGIITADTLEQAIDRVGVKAGNKGSEAAFVAVEMVNLFRSVTDMNKG